ncbi:MAG TPA: hypothetical protein VKQ32_24730 [Polyangia bacterium]|nr:hypothetical protein [Polyangia bacterium]
MTAGSDAQPLNARPAAWPLAAAFSALIALTICELLVAGLAAERAARITALAGLLMIKVALVLSFFMQARKRRRSSVGAFVSIAFAAGVAVVLMLETVFRAGVR